MVPGTPPPGYAELHERLRVTKIRLGQAHSKVSDDARDDDEPNKRMLSLAFRFSTEIIAALIVGVGGGLLLDDWLQAKPFWLVLGFLLGAAAGVANVYRAVSGIDYTVGYGLGKPPPADGIVAIPDSEPDTKLS